MNKQKKSEMPVAAATACSAVLESHEEWDDAKFRHAYFPKDPVAMCGYDGERTWKNEASPPDNLCPICAAIYPEYWDGSKWISLPNSVIE